MPRTRQIARSQPKSSAEFIELENAVNAHNYHPIPAVLTRGEGVFLFDVEGKRYYDFMSAYSAVNQGHCHPRILRALSEQAAKLTLTSRAFHNDQLGPYCQFMTQVFGFQRLLPMNSGVEACETAVKLARRWGYDVKRVPSNEARVIFARNNFWGRSIAACSASTDPTCSGGFGPFVPGFDIIPYNDVAALKQALEGPQGDKVVAFMVEPIQGEAGIMVPDDDYLPKVAALCKQHNILLILDEVQTGLGRTGKLMAYEHWGVKPDLVCLGKALSGGVLPVSAVMGSDEVLLTIKPGEHGSTYGGNPLACAVAMAAVEVLLEEGLVENSEARGQQFRQAATEMMQKYPSIIKQVRGKGLMNAVEVHELGKSMTAWDICLMLKERGLLAKQTHDTIIRMAPPLTITKEQMDECIGIMTAVFAEVAAKTGKV